MPFDWKSNAEDQGNTSSRIPAGTDIPVTIDRVLTQSKSKGAFKSSKGDPQIMVIYVDEHDNEAGEMLTLSDKGAWKLSRLLSRFGANLDDLTSAGIEPKHFTKKEIYQRYLVGLSGLVNIEWVTGTNGKEYPEVDPVENSSRPRKEPAAAAKSDPMNPLGRDAYTQVAAEDIPF